MTILQLAQGKYRIREIINGTWKAWQTSACMLQTVVVKEFVPVG